MIKVCGVTRIADMEILPEAGVTAVGLNFVPSSPRCVALDHGAQLAQLARQMGIDVVAVVRDAGLRDLHSLLAAVPLDYLQLHGRETPQFIETLELRSQVNVPPIIRALSWSGRPEEVEFAELWSTYAGGHPQRCAAWLVDAYAPAAGGGTGRLADWTRLNPRPREFGTLPLILAGGLEPGNVDRAIERVHPDGVDTASGVESAPGIKSAALVRRFAQVAQRQFNELT
jgi:phosphoribosylanthranilate isomerase